MDKLFELVDLTLLARSHIISQVIDFGPKCNSRVVVLLTILIGVIGLVFFKLVDPQSIVVLQLGQIVLRDLFVFEYFGVGLLLLFVHLLQLAVELLKELLVLFEFAMVHVELLLVFVKRLLELFFGGSEGVEEVVMLLVKFLTSFVDFSVEAVAVIVKFLRLFVQVGNVVLGSHNSSLRFRLVEDAEDDVSHVFD